MSRHFAICSREMRCKRLRDKTIVAFLYNTGLRQLKCSISNVVIDLNERKAVAKTFKEKHHQARVYWDEETNRLLARCSKFQKILGRRIAGVQALFISFNTATDP